MFASAARSNFGAVIVVDVEDADRRNHSSGGVSAASVAGGDDHECDGGADERDRARDRRDHSRDRRDEAGDQRDKAGERRDQTAGERDQAAEARDQAAEARDQAAEARDQAAERSEGAEHSTRTDDAQVRSTNARREAAADRRRASQDRRAGARVRAQAETDRNTALSDRGAGAIERNQAETDRNTALADRDASARERDSATIDDLTGAQLRGPGFVELEQEMARSTRSEQPLVVAFVDVNGLKAVNDSRGHAAGDRMLVEVAVALREQLRTDDLIIRYGGDEFVCAIPGLTIADATDRFALVNAALGSAPEHGSVTVGLSVLEPGDSAESLVERADAALYRQRR